MNGSKREREREKVRCVLRTLSKSLCLRKIGCVCAEEQLGSHDSFP